MVVNAAPVHLLQAVLSNGAGLFVPGELGIAKKKNQVVGRRKLGRGAEAAVFPVIRGIELFYGPLEKSLSRLRVPGRKLPGDKIPDLRPGL